MLDRPTFENTRRALKDYDAKESERQKAWDTADDTLGVDAAEAMELAHLRLVRLAFFDDTKDRNSVDRCMIADLAFMRRCATKVG